MHDRTYGFNWRVLSVEFEIEPKIYTVSELEQYIDFCACKYIGDVFKEMRIKMEWDSWYGENLDALWDILTGLPYKGDDFTIIRPKRFVGIPHGKNATFTKYVDKICSIFQEAQEQGDLTVQIEYIENKSSKDNSVYMV